MTHFLTTQVGHHGYLAVFLLMALESACIPIPSEVVMPYGGALAAGAFGGAGSHVSLVGIALAGAAGNLVGSLVAYAVGRFGGRPFLDRYGRYVLLRPEHLDRADRFFARRGDTAVFVGRLLPVIRTFISLPAGIAEMPVVRFSAFTFLGSLPWTFALAGAGYALAAHWHSVASVMSVVSIVVVVLLGLAVVAWFGLRHRNRRSPGPIGTGPTPSEGADDQTGPRLQADRVTPATTKEDGLCT